MPSKGRIISEKYPNSVVCTPLNVQIIQQKHVNEEVWKQSMKQHKGEHT